ncbi:hypothetical protein KVT40_001678 [Elsinoe batatas]|uniref:Methyltransferase domain-containing protein n=1 Tax=Elsinoe batatas TaxID=2601811 RepID=A0A8K0PLK8_9PEZI|nr:hypothetical protein KVT40_001678 [Elsinoe batatas]
MSPSDRALIRADQLFVMDAEDRGNRQTSRADKRYQSDAQRTADLIFAVMTGSIPKGLEHEIILLKREEDTLALHEMFSTDKSEPSSLVLQRISKARKEARNIAAYTCISEYLFAEPRIDRHFEYRNVIADRQRNCRLVDVGCCMGTDMRKLIQDGFPAQNVTGIDCQPKFFDIGLELYNHTQKDLKVHLIGADVLASDFFDRHQGLKGTFDIVHSANVIHLFDRKQQIRFLSALAFLVKPGGLVWGRQVGEDENSPTWGKKIAGKGERFTPAEFRTMWIEATGWSLASWDYCSRLVIYDELRLIPDYKRLSLEWSVRAGPEWCNARSAIEEVT